ncbi:endonuclease/exonuclease/phosphatase family protein [Chitinibacter sp. FCG-7]|uniref:Endonuclease/exonuclease/phosphatase family protein n=1 Tax=Chitinibacter mangrovi TaxID=3153927 RepID=A0AAU7F8C4_9NEIS
MKIISWNCNGGLRNKTYFLDQFDADILVVQECENPVYSTHAFRDWAGQYLWHGDNKNKGVGIFARKGHHIAALDWSSAEYEIRSPSPVQKSLKWQANQLELFLPCLINQELTLIGAWTKQANSPNFCYIGQLWLYLQMQRDKIAARADSLILCGDLNSNPIWDEADRFWNHSDVVAELQALGLQSAYHCLKAEVAGQETDPTFYLHRKESKAYHIDYFFVPERMLPTSKLMLSSVTESLHVSDHRALILDIGSASNETMALSDGL